MRLQILELPARVVGEVVETPCVIVISEASDAFRGEGAKQLRGLTGVEGVQHVLVTNETVEIGAP